MIKLYIFDTVQDARAFELGEPIQEPHQEEKPEKRKPRRKAKRYSKRKSNPEKEAFKQRILAKAKGGRGVRHCKRCGEAGHRSDGCPNKAEKKDGDGFSSYDE